MTRLMFLFVVALSLLMVGCPDDGETTDTQDDDETGYVLPKEVKNTIPASYLDRMIEEGFMVNDGMTPPDITDRYLADKLRVVYDDGGEYDLRITDYVYTFHSFQGSEIQVDYMSNLDDSGEGIGSYISGEDDCFTVYSIFDGTIHGDCTYQGVELYSGCLVSEGIDEFQTAFVLTEQAAECEGRIMPNGDLRILEQRNGLVKRVPFANP